MDRVFSKNRATYDVLLDDYADYADSAKPSNCSIRDDDRGVWNGVKAWYLSILHLLASIAMAGSIALLDKHAFRIGAAPLAIHFDLPLWQTEVNALISSGLVINRVIAGSCSALLTWRIIFILLEKRGISLVELSRLAGLRIPILSGTMSHVAWRWSLWAMVSVLLTWPQGFAAPLASSSIAWNPGTRLLQEDRVTFVSSVEEYMDTDRMFYPEFRMSVVLGAAAMAAMSPQYAFTNNSTSLPLRRYFNTSQPVPDGSIMNIVVPYFAVDLRWIDASSDDRSVNAGNSTSQDVVQDFNVQEDGAVGIVRHKPWNSITDIRFDNSLFIGEKLVVVKVRTVHFDDQLPDGSIAGPDSTCPTVSDDFGALPNVQQQKNFLANGADQKVGFDCYIIAKANITAGSYYATDCDVSSPLKGSLDLTTCFIDRVDSFIPETHPLTRLSLDFTSNVLKYLVLQNYSQPWISGDLEAYTSGQLTLGFQAAWSGLTKTLGNMSEPSSFTPTEQVVYASVDRNRVIGWLLMNLTLTASAVLVWIGQYISATKTIRDAVVAALTINMAEVTHNKDADGLCNAVALSTHDSKLPKMKWKDDRPRARTSGSNVTTSCVRSVVLENDSSFELIQRRA